MLALFGAAIAQDAGTVAQDPAGDPTCPCIDVRMILDSNQSEFLYAARHGKDPDLYRYPNDYGSSLCRAWDEALEPSCAHADGRPLQPRPEFCTKAWCYVDREVCKESVHDVEHSLFFPTASPLLFFSYGTCGSSVSPYYADRTVATVEPGSTLEIVLPMMTHPRHFKRYPDGTVAIGAGPLYRNDSVPWEGSMIEYAQALRNTTPYAAFKFTHTSLYSMARYGSSWTAAVNDVATGVSSVSTSDFWVTAERTALVQFTSSIGSDRMMLWAKRPKKKTGFWARASKVFEPLHWSVWLMCVMVAFVVACLLNLVFTVESPARRAIKEARSKKITWAEALDVLGHRILHSFGVNGLLFLGRDETFPETTALLIIAVGFSFFILIITTAYTANLAAILTHDAPGDYIRSMEDAIAKGARVCTPGAILTTVKYQYPTGTFVRLTTSVGAALDQGECDAFIFAYAVVREQSFVDAMCKHDMASMQTVLDVPLAFPATSSAVAPFSHYIHKMPLGRNTYQDQYERPFWVDRCPGPGGRVWQDIGPAARVDDVEQLYVTHFSGALIALFAFIIAAWSQLEGHRVVEVASHVKAKHFVKSLNLLKGVKEHLAPAEYKKKLVHFFACVEVVEKRMMDWENTAPIASAQHFLQGLEILTTFKDDLDSALFKQKLEHYFACLQMAEKRMVEWERAASVACADHLMKGLELLKSYEDDLDPATYKEKVAHYLACIEVVEKRMIEHMVPASSASTTATTTTNLTLPVHIII